MSMTRRDVFKVAGVAAAATAISGCAAGSAKPEAEASAPAMLMGPSNGKRVVVIGGGFGGLTVAKQLRKISKDLEVVVLEKKDIFMACPFSNTYLGGLSEVDLGVLTHDFYAPAQKHGYHFIQCAVTSINRDHKAVHTTKGSINYDILVLSPGIEYDYEGQFPNWSKEKIAQVQQDCPAALMPGSEHLALKRQLMNMDDGNVIIVPPAKGKYRCPPAPYERTAMVANYMKEEGIEGKVVVLDTRGGKFAKGAAFKESWGDLFGDMIDYRGSTEVVDVDTAKKTVTFKEYKNEDDLDGTIKTISYQVCNLIPVNKAATVMNMSGIKVNGAGFAIMEGLSYRSVSDKNVYVVGDAVAHKIPPSGQTAIWSGKEAAKQIAAQLLEGKMTDTSSVLPYNAANVCYSMVGGNPEEAIMVTHAFSADPASGNIKGKGNVPKPKDGNGKYRSKGVGKATREWFRGVMGDLFS